MEGEQFSLCWNNFHTNLSSGFHTLLKDEDLVDVTLAAEGRYLKAHKTVLSVCSPFFKELFRVNPCKHPIVVLQDVNYGALCNLLQFMYLGEVSVSQEEIPTFMRVAETLKVKGLTDNNNAASSAASTATNGFENRRSNFQMSDAMKRPRPPMKKMMKPIQQIRPVDSPKMVRSPQPQPQGPPMKKIHLEETQTSSSQAQQSSSKPPTPQPPPMHRQPSPQMHRQPSPQMHRQPSPQMHRQPSPQSHHMHRQPSPVSQHDFPLLTPKLEPLDPSDMNDDGDDNMDMSSMLDSKMEPAPSPQSSTSSTKEGKTQWKKQQEDVSTPGTLQCILGRRGNPRLIVDGHVFYKKSTYKGMVLLRSGRGQLVLIYFGHIYTLSESRDNRNIWVCVKKNTFNCDGQITTLNGPVLVSHSGHNHPQLHDVIQRLQTPNLASISPELT